MKEAKLVQQEEWEAIYTSTSFRNKNQYPSEEVVSFVMRRFGQREDKAKINILDLGCGWGNNLAFLSAQGFSYSGIDFSEKAVEHCRLKHANVICGRLMEMPFPVNTFDLAFDRMAIQHNKMEEVVLIFAEVYRVLKPGGLFYSALIESGEYSVLTTFLNETKIRKLAGIFSEFTVDYVVQTENDQKQSMKTNILIAKK